MPPNVKVGDTVRGAYFGVPFHGTVSKRIDLGLRIDHYTIVRLTRAIPEPHGGKEKRTVNALFDYQLDRPDLQCALEVSHDRPV